SIEEETVWKGIDPREFLFVAGGGAAGLHINQICSQLGVKKAIIPKVAGTLSAAGGLFADVVGEFSIGEFTDTSMFDFKKVNLALKKLEKQANKFLDKNSIPKNRRIIELYCEARYPYQVVEQLIPLKVNDFENEKDVKILTEDFHKVHENIYGVKEKNNIECVNWQVRA